MLHAHVHVARLPSFLPSFRSVLVPLRAVLSISLTVCWVYGILVFIYQEGGLEWMGVSCWMRTPSGICWFAPDRSFVTDRLRSP